MVLIESFKHKKQAWHVDTPYPHVYVNILYLDEGQYMTQTLRPRKDSAAAERAIPKAPLQQEPFHMEVKKLSPKWREYLAAR